MVTVHSVAGSVAAEVTIAVPPERVWRAITTAEEQARFIPGYQGGHFGSRVGEAIEFIGSAGAGGVYTFRGKIIEFNPPRQLAFTWNWPGSLMPETVISFTLEAIEGGTRLSFLQSGFGDQFEQARLIHEGQFSAAMERLKPYLEGER